MPEFNLHLYALPLELREFSTDSTAKYRTYPEDAVKLLNTELMDASLEDFADRASQLPRLYFEMDGSFVWRGETESSQAAWQVDGMIYDRADKICRMEIKGNCPLQPFKQLIQCVGSVDQLVAHCQTRREVWPLTELLRTWTE